MKAIAYSPGSALSDARSLFDTEKAEPVLGDHDLLVGVRAVSVNPVDTKVRDGRVFLGDAIDVLGWDVAGIVVAAGPEATLFRPGDEVFYAGSLLRSGGNAELHAVDERLVGRKPAGLTFAEAAALPLTSLTAWELLFERLEVRAGKASDGAALVVIGGAGGVGSMLIQFARRLTGLTVIATASRPESREWCLALGAHAVIDHSTSMVEELRAIHAPPITHIAALAGTDRHWSTIAEIVAPGGKVGVITDHDCLDATPLRAKSASLHWENVVTRTAFGAPADRIAHHTILQEVSALVEARVVRSTMRRELRTINAANLREAHALVESGGMQGKVVIAEPS